MDIKNHIFDSFLLSLEPGLPDSASRYKLFRSKMVKFFEWRQCEDAAGLADETIARSFKQISAGTQILAEDPYPYVYGIAKNLYKEYVRRQVRDEKLAKKIEERPAPAEESHDCRAQCLRQVPEGKLKLLQRYYLHPEERETLALEHNMTMNALRLQVHRLKKELKECQEDCMRKLLRS
ncbi:MAG TPA: hypothetical protein VE262_20360 [Blastocatellia bacterium]|nr:hypothetical protein [Blastocatellia bacterium]